MKFYSHQKNGKGRRKTLIFGISFSAASFFILAFISSLAVSAFKNPLGIIGISSLITLLFSGALSGFCTAKFKGKGGIGEAGISALVFALILISAGLIMTHGNIPLLTFANMAAYLIISLIFAAIANRKGKARRR